MDLKFIQNNVKGNKNNNTPVILFKRVCSTISLFVQTTPNIILAFLIPAIAIIRIHSHMKTPIPDNILINKTVTNIKWR